MRVLSWRRGSESNRRIKVLQTSPLPLGYRALLPHGKSLAAAGLLRGNLERETGVEPATSTLARSRSTTELLPLDASFYTRWDSGGQRGIQIRDSDPGFSSGFQPKMRSTAGGHFAGPLHGLPVALCQMGFGEL